MNGLHLLAVIFPLILLGAACWAFEEVRLVVGFFLFLAAIVAATLGSVALFIWGLEGLLS